MGLAHSPSRALGLICTKTNDGAVGSRMGLLALVMLSLSLSEKSFIQWIALPNVCATGAESDTVWLSDMHNYRTTTFRFLSSELVM